MKPYQICYEPAAPTVITGTGRDPYGTEQSFVWTGAWVPWGRVTALYDIQWTGEVGEVVPKPQAEVDQILAATIQLKDAVDAIEEHLFRADHFLFRLILSLFDVGVANGVWTAADFPPAIKDKVILIKQKLDELNL